MASYERLYLNGSLEPSVDFGKRLQAMFEGLTTVEIPESTKQEVIAFLKRLAPDSDLTKLNPYV